MKSASGRPAVAVTAVATAVGILAAPGISVATAQTDGAEEQTGSQSSGTSLSFGQLGAPESLDMVGRMSSASLTLPVPDGLTPAALRGVVQVPASFISGVLEVVQEGRVIGRESIDPGASTTGVPVSVSLDDATVRGGAEGDAVTVELRTSFTPVDEGWCHDPLDMMTTVFRDASVSYDGEVSAPTTVADAFPSVLSDLEIAVPQDPDDDVTAAALEVATAVSARYRDQDPDITVTDLGSSSDSDSGTDSDSYDSSSFSRRIEIPGTGDPEVSVVDGGSDDARYVLSGSGTDLADQVRLFTGNYLTLLDSDSASAQGRSEGDDDAVELAPTARTVSDLGNVNLSAQGFGTAAVSFGIDQGALGRLADNVHIHLSGSHTPLPTDAGGEVTVAANGQVIDRWAVSDSNGVIDREIDVPSELLDRYNDITVTLNGSGQAGCGTTSPVTLRIDGDSVVTSDPADDATGQTAGFRALPQALTPETDVVLTDGGIADIRRAVAVLTGFQETTPARIRPVLAGDDASADDSSRARLVIDADGSSTGGPDGTDGTDLPVTLRDGVLTVNDGSGSDDGDDSDGAGHPALDASVDTDFGALQTAWDEDNGRMQVVANSTDRADLLDRLLTTLDGSADSDAVRFGDLRGRAVIQQVSGDPVEVGVPDRTSVSADSADSDDNSATGGLSTAGILGVVAGVIVLAGAVIATLGWTSRRRKGDDK